MYLAFYLFVVCRIVRSVLILILSLVSLMMTMMFLSCNVIVIVYIFKVKGYIRKGHALLTMKDLSKARQAFQTAVDLDPNSAVSLHSDCPMIAHLLILFDHIPCTMRC